MELHDLTYRIHYDACKQTNQTIRNPYSPALHLQGLYTHIHTSTSLSLYICICNICCCYAHPFPKSTHPITTNRVSTQHIDSPHALILSTYLTIASHCTWFYIRTHTHAYNTHMHMHIHAHTRTQHNTTPHTHSTTTTNFIVRDVRHCAQVQRQEGAGIASELSPGTVKSR